MDSDRDFGHFKSRNLSLDQQLRTLATTMVDLEQGVASLSRVGHTLARRLNKLQIFTIKDLLFHFPSRYEDLSRIILIANLVPQTPTTVVGTVWQIKNLRTTRGKMLTFAKIADDSGVLDIVWFNQPYLTRNIKTGQKVSLSGKLGEFNSKPAFINPDYEVITSVKESLGTIHTGRIVPIYPETSGVTSKWLRSRIDSIFREEFRVPDYLPAIILESEKFPDLEKSLKSVHFPKSLDESQNARERLAFDELFLLQAQAYLYKKLWSREAKTKPLTIGDDVWHKVEDSLPFELTCAQAKVVEEIRKDMAKKVAMNRLLEGDVGSGKTVVAGLASYICFKNSVKAVIMAPTEILAIQHHNTLTSLFSPLGLKIDLVTGSKKPKNLDNLGDIVVGTHALLQEKISFENTGLLVIDEQHRFGVQQRALLRSKTKTPHILTMTATPIPRTLALTIYGDLELSVIDELPLKRLKILTYVVPQEKRSAAYKYIEDKVKKGDQAFIICPFIDPSESLETVKSAKEEFARLQKEIFPNLRLALLHGNLKGKEKEEILVGFRNNKYDILVATPVVEVGIDIPNATIMMIETSERFGLAALHQLRGRVGRGVKQSYCLLFTESTNPKVINRLKLLTRIYSGLKLAEMDLKMRGPGEMYGTAQHGLLDLKIADLSDLHLIERTKIWFSKLIGISPKLNRWPLLRDQVFKNGGLVSPD